MKTRAMLYYAENLAHEIQARLRLAFAPGRDPREVVGNRRLIKKKSLDFRIYAAGSHSEVLTGCS